MSTHAPAQTSCFDSFWALERATQSKSHRSQWKNSSSLQWALDPAHTTAANDREPAINNYDIPHRYRRDKFAPKARILFLVCVPINSGRFIPPGNFQGAKNQPTTSYFQTAEETRMYSYSLMSDPKVSVESFQSTSSLAQGSTAPWKSTSPFLWGRH